MKSESCRRMHTKYVPWWMLCWMLLVIRFLMRVFRLCHAPKLVHGWILSQFHLGSLHMVHISVGHRLGTPLYRPLTYMPSLWCNRECCSNLGTATSMTVLLLFMWSETMYGHEIIQSNKLPPYTSLYDNSSHALNCTAKTQFNSLV